MTRGLFISSLIVVLLSSAVQADCPELPRQLNPESVQFTMSDDGLRKFAVEIKFPDLIQRDCQVFETGHSHKQATLDLTTERFTVSITRPDGMVLTDEIMGEFSFIYFWDST